MSGRLRGSRAAGRGRGFRHPPVEPQPRVGRAGIRRRRTVLDLPRPRSRAVRPGAQHRVRQRRAGERARRGAGRGAARPRGAAVRGAAELAPWPAGRRRPHVAAGHNGRVLPPAELGEFSFRPQQGLARSVFVPLARLQAELEQEGRVNTVLLQAAGAERGRQPRPKTWRPSRRPSGPERRSTTSVSACGRFPRTTRLSVESAAGLLDAETEAAAGRAAAAHRPGHRAGAHLPGQPDSQRRAGDAVLAGNGARPLGRQRCGGHIAGGGARDRSRW